MPGFLPKNFKAQLRKLKSSGKKPPFRLKGPHGQNVVLDSAVADFFLSKAQRPSQASLDKVLESATSLTVFEPRIHKDGVVGSAPVLETRDPTDLRRLRDCLKIVPTDGHLLMDGDTILKIEGPRGELATLELLCGTDLRWNERWRSDASLVDDGRRLLRWFARRGYAKPLRKFQADVRERRKDEREREAWRKAMPRCLDKLWPHFFSWAVMGEGELMARGGKLLRKSFASNKEAVLALIAWCGWTNKTWETVPCQHEGYPAQFLLQFPTSTIIDALMESKLRAKHIEGAARFFSSRDFWGARPQDAALVPDRLLARLRSRVQGHAENRSRFESRFPA